MSLTFEINGKKIKVREEVVVLGRDASCQVILQDPTVSRRHAQVTCGEEGCELEDLGSVHGVTLNGAPLTVKSRIYRGDEIGIGGVVVKVMRGPRRTRRPTQKRRAAGMDQTLPADPSGTVMFDPRMAPVPAKQRQTERRKARRILMVTLVGVVGLLLTMLAILPSRSPKRKVPSLEGIAKQLQQYLDSVPAPATEGLDENQVAQLAKQTYENAEARFQLLEVSPGNAFEAYAGYRKAELLLRKANQRPDYYDRLLHHEGISRQRVEQQTTTHMQEGWVAQKKGKWEQAYQHYEMVLATVPQRDFPLAEEARRQMRTIAAEMQKKRK